MSKLKIENIFPGVDENGNDVLKFELDGKKVSERIDPDYSIRKDETSDLVKDWGVDVADANAINTQLEAWAAENKDTRFGRASDNSLVETVEYGVRASNDEVAVWLTKEGEKELSIDGGYSIERGNVVTYESAEFGSQEFDNSNVDHDNRVKQAFYENPENSIDQIQSRHAEMREEAKETNADAPSFYELSWHSDNGDMYGGTYQSKAEALAAIPATVEEFNNQRAEGDEQFYADEFSVTYNAPSEFVENIRVDDNNGQLFAYFDVKAIDINGDEKVYSTGDWIDLKDGLLVDDGRSNVWVNNYPSEFDREEVTATVNRHLSANPVSEKTLETYRADAEAVKAREDDERERMVAR